jgi:hypothetical protein
MVHRTHHLIVKQAPVSRTESIRRFCRTAAPIHQLSVSSPSVTHRPRHNLASRATSPVERRCGEAGWEGLIERHGPRARGLHPREFGQIVVAASRPRVARTLHFLHQHSDQPESNAPTARDQLVRRRCGEIAPRYRPPSDRKKLRAGAQPRVRSNTIIHLRANWIRSGVLGVLRRQPPSVLSLTRFPTGNKAHDVTMKKKKESRTSFRSFWLNKAGFLARP